MERARTLPLETEIDFGGGPPSSPIRLMVTDSPFMDLAVTGSLGGTTVHSRDLSCPVHPPPRKQQEFAHYIVLLESSIGYSTGCLRFESRIDWTAVVRICTTKRRVFGRDRRRVD
jgi:hypothetical protein